mgnify:CR=1 FL=1
MNNALGEYVNQYRTEHNLSLRDFAKLAEISHTHIDSIEKGVDYRTGKPVRITNETIQKLAKALHADESYLFELSIGRTPSSENTTKVNSTNSRHGVKIPVLGQVQAGIPIDAVQDILDYEEITEDMAAHGEYFALQVRGSSMEPRMREGDVVIVRQQPEVENGETAIILVNGNDATIKRVRKSSEGIMLVPTNPVFEPIFYNNEEIEELPVVILGKVVELRAKF